jgi:hypothetical protein
LCYAEHENGEANAAYVPVLTGECQAIAGFRYKALIPYIGISGQHLILTKNQNTTVIHPYTVHLKKSLPDE